MLRVPIRMARPGMRLAFPVRHPKRREQILLRGDFTLDGPAIQRLRDLDLPEVWIQYPNLDFVGRYIHPAILDGQCALTTTIGSMFDSLHSGVDAQLDYRKYKLTIRDFIDRLLERPNAALMLQELGSASDPLMRHSANVCYLSLLMGLSLEGYLVRQRPRLPPHLAKDVVSLGVGAMLHDVGMTRLEQGVVRRWRETRDERDPAWREHVILGFETVRGNVEPSAAAAVLHHHQRWDGSGFPRKPQHGGRARGLEGEHIHVFARIIATADTFDRLRRPHDDTERVPAVRVLKRMLQPDIARRLDPVTLSALLAVTPAYAPGSLVRLSDGRDAVVIGWTREDPCRPTVQALDEGAMLEPRAAPDEEPVIIALQARDDLRIVESEGCDVSADNFSLPRDHAVDVRALQRAI